MPDHELTMNLARLVIATAWADGKLEYDEVPVTMKSNAFATSRIT